MSRAKGRGLKGNGVEWILLLIVVDKQRPHGTVKIRSGWTTGKMGAWTMQLLNKTMS